MMALLKKHMKTSMTFSLTLLITVGVHGQNVRLTAVNRSKDIWIESPTGRIYSCGGIVMFDYTDS